MESVNEHFQVEPEKQHFEAGLEKQYFEAGLEKQYFKAEPEQQHFEAKPEKQHSEAEAEQQRFEPEPKNQHFESALENAPKTEPENQHFEAKPENEHIKDTKLKLKQFCYYFVHLLEQEIQFYLGILEEHAHHETTPSSLPGTAASYAASLIPTVGKGASVVTQQIDKFLQSKIDKRNAKTFANLIYRYRDDRTGIKQLLAKAAIEIFRCFEMQFADVVCDAGSAKAMQKLADDGVHRAVQYFLESSIDYSISVDVVIKAVLRGESKGGTMRLRKLGRSVNSVTSGKTVKTKKIYTKSGICLMEAEAAQTANNNKQMLYFKNEHTKTRKYGHRLKFAFEDSDAIKKEWLPDTPEFIHTYKLNNFDSGELFQEVWLYILKQNPLDEVKFTVDKQFEQLDGTIGKACEEASEDRQKKHEESALHRLSILGQTVGAVKESKAEISSELEDAMAEASNERIEIKRETLDVISSNHEEAKKLRHKSTKEVVTEIRTVSKVIGNVMQDMETIKAIKSEVKDLRNELSGDDKILVMINKAALENSGDVQKIKREVGRIQEQIREHPDIRNVREFFKKF